MNHLANECASESWPHLVCEDIVASRTVLSVLVKRVRESLATGTLSLNCIQVKTKRVFRDRPGLIPRHCIGTTQL